jgi:hypothetical protein
LRFEIIIIFIFYFYFYFFRLVYFEVVLYLFIKWCFHGLLSRHFHNSFPKHFLKILSDDTRIDSASWACRVEFLWYEWSELPRAGQ